MGSLERERSENRSRNYAQWFVIYNCTIPPANCKSEFKRPPPAVGGTLDRGVEIGYNNKHITGPGILIFDHQNR